jgi:MOSC domain-containing protein YiiM
MKLLSINVSLPKTVEHNGKMIKTGIFKKPAEGRVTARTLGLDGDGQGDLRVHGGVYKAVYLYSIENYSYWGNKTGRTDLTYGQFGENLTVEGMLEDKVHIGDVFRIGDALFEVTQPRVPCFKLGVKMKDPEFIKPFLASKRVGFYVRVLEEGAIGAGDVIEQVKAGPEQMAVRRVLHLRYFDKTNRQGVEKVLSIPALSPSWRDSFEELLANIS